MDAVAQAFRQIGSKLAYWLVVWVFLPVVAIVLVIRFLPIPSFLKRIIIELSSFVWIIYAVLQMARVFK
ncbi:MAG TPA: hypothetical protein GXX19_09615 [Syntrophomonadaceae bacterium]|nr:hypothetical protein [Syntrophomonadaceae bacterium]